MAAASFSHFTRTSVKDNNLPPNGQNRITVPKLMHFRSLCQQPGES